MKSVLGLAILIVTTVLQSRAQGIWIESYIDLSLTELRKNFVTSFSSQGAGSRNVLMFPPRTRTSIWSTRITSSVWRGFSVLGS